MRDRCDRKASQKEYLLSIGAAEVIDEEVLAGIERPLMERRAGVVMVV
jgi:hypothetical protein